MDNAQLNSVGTRIRELRAEKKLSQAELGEILSVSQDTISLWENCKSLPTVEIILKLSEIFEVSCDYLLGKSEY